MLYGNFLKCLMNIFPVYLDSFEVCVEGEKLQYYSGIVYSWQNKLIKMRFWLKWKGLAHLKY